MSHKGVLKGKCTIKMKSDPNTLTHQQILFKIHHITRCSYTITIGVGRGWQGVGGGRKIMNSIPFRQRLWESFPTKTVGKLSDQLCGNSCLNCSKFKFFFLYTY
jgi:hypothetical protein